MNIQEYISSGIIESYVLGLVSSEERIEFEKFCGQYPELVQAREEFERMIEKQAIENAIQPGHSVRSRIWEQIKTSKPEASRMQAPVRSMNWAKWAAAACLVLLLGSVYWNYNLINKNKKLREDVNSSAAQLKDIEKEIAIIRQNPNIKMASMKGMEAAPQAMATVYWDTTSHDVYLLVNNLPMPSSDKQYQLWALLDGKPIDMGVFDMNEIVTHKMPLLYQMKNAQGAQAFAITLEKKGGNASPKGPMYTMGKL